MKQIIASTIPLVSVDTVFDEDGGILVHLPTEIDKKELELLLVLSISLSEREKCELIQGMSGLTNQQVAEVVQALRKEKAHIEFLDSVQPGYMDETLQQQQKKFKKYLQKVLKTKKYGTTAI